MAPTNCVRLRYTDKRNVPARQVNHHSGRKRQPGRVQRSPALHLFRRYGPRSNHGRRVWWHLACRHTELDVGTSLDPCAGKEDPLGPFSPAFTPPVIRRVGADLLASSAFFLVLTLRSGAL